MHRGSQVLAAVLLTVLVFATREAHSDRSADEQNNIDVFKRASAGVVHITAHSFPATKAGIHKGNTGTGFVIDREGHVLTAYHVVRGMDKVNVVIEHDRILPATVVGTAPELDVVLLRITADPDDLRPLVLGGSDALQVGQKVLAIGNGLGLHNSMSVGVVSALGRSLRGAPTELETAFIQTDAAINPGNSGGPLLDSDGAVVGINDAVVPGAQAVGFAIPIELAASVLPDLIRMGHVYRPKLGLSGTMLAPRQADSLGLRVGFLVQEVLPESPAARAGLRAGRAEQSVRGSSFIHCDVIIETNGSPVTGAGDLSRTFMRSKPGDVIHLLVQRQGRSIELRLVMPRMDM